MLEITVLGSGSSGNATLVRSEKTALLIDAGFSLRQLTIRMATCGCSPDLLDGVLISHEHTDHITGLRVLNNKYPLPVYSSQLTLGSNALDGSGLTKKENIEAGIPFTVGDFEITPFTVPHDAIDPFGFIIESHGIRIGYVTDLGYATELVRHHLRGCNLLVLESNHDRDMLLEGPYPWPIKQRIMSRTGHLSNSDTATLLSDILHSDLTAVCLAHLSRENNTPILAEKSCQGVLGTNGDNSSPRIIVTNQHNPSPTIQLD